VSHWATASVALMAGDRAVGAGAAASLHFIQFSRQEQVRKSVLEEQ